MEADLGLQSRYYDKDDSQRKLQLNLLTSTPSSYTALTSQVL